MPLILRNVKGSALTINEMDDNLEYLYNRTSIGTSGTAGTSGVQGAQGFQGAQGLTGAQGLKETRDQQGLKEILD